mmetsp:Transcript_96446/g.251404  ORF Transcript_96446/g.251404 Transcript_96446/m.251404 type:complete len:225 (+) Transcript_96446:828-1502(+)
MKKERLLSITMSRLRIQGYARKAMAVDQTKLVTVVPSRTFRCDACTRGTRMLWRIPAKPFHHAILSSTLAQLSALPLTARKQGLSAMTNVRGNASSAGAAMHMQKARRASSWPSPNEGMKISTANASQRYPREPTNMIANITFERTDSGHDSTANDMPDGPPTAPEKPLRNLRPRRMAGLMVAGSTAVMVIDSEMNKRDSIRVTLRPQLSPMGPATTRPAMEPA